MANGSLPSISGVFCAAGFGASCAPRLRRAAEGTRSTLAVPQVGHSRILCFFWALKSSAALTHLLFLHGLGGGHHAWDAQLVHFSTLGYAAHAWDQPGYGHSAMVEPYDLEQVSAAFARLIESLGGEPVVLVGHSMGGLIAQ